MNIGGDNINIKLIGANCSNGIKLSKLLDKVIEENNIKANVEKLNNNKYGIKNIPGLVINGQIVSEGKIPSLRELKRLLV